ncbi:MAG: glycosyltransferase family 4 protein [Myxococcaceae bacterium]|nr:glycosyltransferase family 4 protein [Myxococcaceae bacterium]
MAGRAPRKVLHVMNAAVGGAALSTLGLMRELQKRGIASSAVCHDAGSPEEREAIREATLGEVVFTSLYWWNKKIRTPGWKRPLSEAKQWLRTGVHRVSAAKVAMAYRKWGADLLHSNTLTTIEGAVVSRWLDVPHVWHVRERVGPGNPFVFPLEGDGFLRFLSRHADVVIANSHTSAVPLRSPLLGPQLRVIPNGLALDAYLALPRRQDVKVIVAKVGNLTSAVKKHSLFIEAATRVKSSTEVEFRLYGLAPEPGTHRHVDELRAQAARCNVRVMGFVDPVQIMKEIDVLVHAADGESFGRVIVEGMGAGLPVVGVNGGGVAELVQHEKTGLLGPIDDAGAMAAHLQRLIDDAALRAHMGDAGRVVAKTKYSIEGCATAVASAYADALATHSRAASQMSLFAEWARGHWPGL